MEHTGLTVGSFTQPVVAQTLIEIQANVEKGFCQRFLWVVPKPVAIPLDELQQVDREFSTAIGKKAALCVLVRISLHSTLGVITIIRHLCAMPPRSWSYVIPVDTKLFNQKVGSPTAI